MGMVYNVCIQPFLVRILPGNPWKETQHPMEPCQELTTVKEVLPRTNTMGIVYNVCV